MYIAIPNLHGRLLATMIEEPSIEKVLKKTSESRDAKKD